MIHPLAAYLLGFACGYLIVNAIVSAWAQCCQSDRANIPSRTDYIFTMIITVVALGVLCGPIIGLTHLFGNFWVPVCGNTVAQGICINLGDVK